MLVEQSKIGSILKRLFTGEIGELISEIIQNAQRANAETIEFITDTESGTVIITDDGSGLVKDNGTAEQFLPLITVALSNYERAEVADQTTMGVGVFSVLAHKSVTEVEIASNRKSLTLTTEKVWNDQTFWDDWRSNVSDSEFDQGFRLIIKATPQFALHLGNHLQGKHTPGISEPYYFESPARGYFDLLKIFLNGEAVNTENPDDAEKFDLLIADTVYEGAPIKIGFKSDTKSSKINWFGQIISCGNAFSDYFRIYLHIRKGTILTPQSPTRRGLVKDEKLEKLQIFIRDQIRSFILDPENREQLTGVFLKRYEDLDKEWYRNFCPYFTASEWKYDGSPENYETFEGGSCGKLVSYDDEKLLIENQIVVVSELTNKSASWDVVKTDDAEDAEADGYKIGAGISTFIPQIGECYTMTSGNPKRVNIKQLWWKHGEQIKDDTYLDFVEKGHYALISNQENAIPTDQDWKPVTCENNVFVFEYGENFDIASVENLIIGTSSNIKDKIHFLNDEAWACWSYENDESSWEVMEQDFRESLETAKANLFKDTIEEDVFDMQKLKLQCGFNHDEQIVSVNFVYKNNVPWGVKVRTKSGKTAEPVWLKRRIEQHS